eukprot:TRINITY_DN304_c0_g1_i1.p1 TRINITY_DN304_c0_g1~~TRINITY_DN304_c0_g1_i1.p1  ORF type:complete len:154 (-),score=31.50 TRINITY_DN304_c0_g1_i1:93-554(-)
MKAIIVLLIALCIASTSAIPSIATWYCSLDGSKGNCFPGSCGTYTSNGHGVCAMNPQLYGTGGACSYQGPACGSCWSLNGPSGSATVQVTDCCAGYPGNPSCLSDPSDPSCDWCASGDNNHYDLDWDTFNTVCGQNGVNAGHCELNDVTQVGC